MKKTLNSTLSILFASLLLFNCSSDDDGGGTKFLDALVGTFESSSITTTGCTDPLENGTLTCTPFCVSVTINSDGTYTLTDNLENPPVNESGIATITATTILLCETGATDCDEPNDYVLTGNTLLVTFDSDEPGCVTIATFIKQ